MDSLELLFQAAPRLLAHAYARQGQEMDWLARQLTGRLGAQGVAVATVLPLRPDSPTCPHCGRQDSWVRWAGAATPRCLCAAPAEAGPAPPPEARDAAVALPREQQVRTWPHWHAGSRRQIAATQVLLDNSAARLARCHELLARSIRCLEQTTQRG